MVVRDILMKSPLDFWEIATEDFSVFDIDTKEFKSLVEFVQGQYTKDQLVQFARLANVFRRQDRKRDIARKLVIARLREAARDINPDLMRLELN